MYAVTIEDGQLLWAERPDPTPGPGELLVRVEAAGINGADPLQRDGHYPPPPGVVADVPGLEFAGVIEAFGEEVNGFAVGERVMAIVAGGGQAERVVVDARHALHVPDSVTPVEAGGFPEAFTTAYDALVAQGGTGPGSRVLVTGAAGGVGTAAVQLARAMGAEVVASSRNVAAHSMLIGLGAVAAVEPDGVDDVGPFDVVLELVGAASFPTSLSVLAPFGRLVVIGVGGGARAELNLLAVMALRATVTGSTLRGRPAAEKAEIAQRMREHVLSLLASGELTVPVAATYPMSEASAAYGQFTAGGTAGKIVLVSG